MHDSGLSKFAFLYKNALYVNEVLIALNLKEGSRLYV